MYRIAIYRVLLVSIFLASCTLLPFAELPFAIAFRLRILPIDTMFVSVLRGIVKILSLL